MKKRTLVERIIDAVSDEMDINVEPLGSTTWKRKPNKGAEGDTSYYVANAERMIGKSDIDIARDPPPDLLVEVDSSSGSLDKLGIYSAFGIPEVWRYDLKRHAFHIYELSELQYLEMSASRCFPVLTPPVLLEFIELSKTKGAKRAVDAFRQWLTSQLGRGGEVR
jgi:Uma2 family endonuclease